MPRFAANLTTLFTELPMTERFRAAANAGFAGVEILYPYDLAIKDLYRAAVSAGVEMVLINTPPPNWAGGPRGFAAIPGLEQRFRRDFDRALRVAEALKARHMHVMAGKAQGADAYETFLNNLAWAVDRAPHISLTIKPMNAIDVPGSFLTSYDLALEILDEVGAPNLGLQFDSYHAHVITGDAQATLERVLPQLRHVQIANPPGRSEPGPGPIDFDRLLATLAASDYRGWVSAEYHPVRQTEAGLGWLARYGGTASGGAAP